MKRSFLFMVLILALVGCRNRQPITKTTTVTDTVYTTETIVERDTVLYTDTSSVGLSFDCDSLFKALQSASKPLKMKQKNANLVFKIEPGGRLHARASCDSLKVELAIKDKIIKELRKRSEKTTVEIPVKYIPRFVEILAWIGGVLSLIVLVALVIQITKFFR